MRYALHTQAHKGRALYWITRKEDGEVMAGFASPEHSHQYVQHQLAIFEAAAATDAAWQMDREIEGVMREIASAPPSSKTGQGFSDLEGASQ